MRASRAIPQPLHQLRVRQPSRPTIYLLSSHLPRPAVGPERTRISYCAAPAHATCAAFRKESRMKSPATNLDRKSGGSAVEGSAVRSTSHCFKPKRRPPLCHPDRTGISYHAAPKMTSCAAFIKESRMNFVEPIALNRKSGGVEGSAVPFTASQIITSGTNIPFHHPAGPAN